MAAYGYIALPSRSSSFLSSTSWNLVSAPHKPKSPFASITIHHLTLASAADIPGLLQFTHRIFSGEVASGTSYPQEASIGEYTREVFEAYFWAADVFIAIGRTGDVGENTDDGPTAVEGGILQSQNGRSWDECLVGFYYVKPNYPGRSSHICNGGFVIPSAHRKFGYGKTLGKSYLHYAPKLGYKASVFNLVYTTNIGSMKIWDSLGFTRAGLIPRAGRLRRSDGQGEEWVDAIVYYRSLVDDNTWDHALSLHTASES
ncbi:hypothetical protein EW146_g7423 [Bondarzewia mesenterica]|uniref:N-acetyltransferase domain-containing protein n=1 Tax=Bondarzewia mesenterica TaxID=1095465 RepID=A0A4S4LLC7_9AGAM|nr:hypothetical protein EW146_g7423 [Bondarzewia mesenterica]